VSISGSGGERIERRELRRDARPVRALLRGIRGMVILRK
jgi:hypothetical protein